MPLEPIQFPKTASSKKIHKITKNGYIKIQIEPQTPRTNIKHNQLRCPQISCVKCAGYHLKEQCLKPASYHLKEICLKPLNTYAKCANGDGPHLAKYKGCRQFPQI